MRAVCDMAGLQDQAEFISEYPLDDRGPLPHLGFGRMTLLGDAAHPMYPRGSNGAGQAILDARALAGHLKAAGAGDPVPALRAYDAERDRKSTRLNSSH